MGAQYYDDEYITKKLLTINGDIDQYEDMMKRKAAEESDRYKQMETELEKLKQEESDDAETDNAGA